MKEEICECILEERQKEKLLDKIEQQINPKDYPEFYRKNIFGKQIRDLGVKYIGNRIYICKYGIYEINDYCIMWLSDDFKSVPIIHVFDKRFYKFAKDIGNILNAKRLIKCWEDVE